MRGQAQYIVHSSSLAVMNFEKQWRLEVWSHADSRHILIFLYMFTFQKYFSIYFL